MEFSVENLSGLLMRSRLLNPDQVQEVYQRWVKEGKDRVNSSPHYLRWLVQNQYLTEYQASLLSRGHADDFFLNQYKILERIGKGRNSGVYKATHKMGQVVAMKVLPPSKAKDDKLLSRFLREARLALRLKHPNVVRSFEMGQSNSLHYLVMELLEGETLEEVLARRGKLPYREAVRLIYQALQGLQHIHEQGLIHRDLKPSNLMLLSDGKAPDPNSTTECNLKILDIGLGRELYDENAKPREMLTDLTGEGVILGTPDYLSPEQARDARHIDVRSDIYSLGCVLYHCLVGHPPFPDSNMLHQLVRHATETPRPVRELAPDVPEALQQVLNWMLAKEPTDRYPTPDRAARSLQLFMISGAEAKPIEQQSAQMRRYITYLETGEVSKPEPTPNVPVAAQSTPPAPGTGAKKSGPQAPVASGNGAPAAVPKPVPFRGDPKNVPEAVAKAQRAARTPADAQVAKRSPQTKGKSEKRKVKKKDLSGSKKHEVLVGDPVASKPPPTTPEPARSAEFDVELVPLPQLSESTPVASGWLPRCGRDWWLFAFGAGAFLLAIVIGWALAQLTR